VVLVVLDANILVLALITPAGIARRVVHAGIAGRFDYALCPHLATEVEAVTRRPKISNSRTHQFGSHRYATSLR